MKKYFLTVCLIISFFISASAKDSGEQTNESVLLSISRVSLQAPMSLNEKFLQFNDEDYARKKKSNEELEKQSEQNLYDTKSEGFKIGPEFYYFAGAAVLAAVIYFLIPDDEPPSQTNYTFGFPVTPN